MHRTLVALHGSCPLSSLQSLISEHCASADQADVTTDPGSSTATASYSRALCIISQPDPAVLGAVAKLLKPGAQAVLRLHAGSEVMTMVTQQFGTSFKRTHVLMQLACFLQADASSALVLSGFTDCQASTSGGVVTVSCCSMF